MFFEGTFENTQWRKVQTCEVISTEYCLLLDFIIEPGLRLSVVKIDQGHEQTEKAAGFRNLPVKRR